VARGKTARGGRQLAIVTATFREENLPCVQVKCAPALARAEAHRLARDMAGLSGISIRFGCVLQVYRPAMSLVFEAEWCVP